MPKTVLITGATGRLGVRLVERLRARRNPPQLRLLVHSLEKARKIFGKTAELVEHDFSQDDFIGLAQACQGVEAVIHLAGLVDYDAPAPLLHRVNAQGTRQLVQAARLQRVQKFIFVSSTSIYRGVKLTSAKSIRETTRPHPTNAYGKSKLEAEGFVRQSPLNYVILRPPIVYGPGFDQGFSLIARLLSRGRLPYIGKVDNVISFIHVDDLLSSIELALSEKVAREDFLVTSGESFTQKELLDRFSTALRVPKPSRHVPLSAVHALVSLYELTRPVTGKRSPLREYVQTLTLDRRYDISKARKMLHFRPTVTLERGLDAYVSSLKR